MGKVDDLDNRLHRLEGGTDVLKWSAAIVSAVLIGMAAIIVTLQVFMFQNQGSLAAKVDALPGQITNDIQNLTRTLSGSITAARSVEPASPVVIQMPDSWIGVGSTNEERKPTPPPTANDLAE